MKILHAADLHIDSPMRGLDRYEGAPVEDLRNSTRRAVENLIDLALEERVDAVTIGGDVFDGTWPDINTGLWWNRQLGRLTESGIEVFVVHGNHDAVSKLTLRLPSPAGVHVFAAEEAETVVSANLPLAVHGQSYVDRAEQRNLAAAFPQAVAGVFNLGLLHTSLDGRPGHGTYAPCTIATLRDRNYDLWALGHIHKREDIDTGEVRALFPGNPQGRHAGEAGPKGVSIIEVQNGQLAELRHVDVDVSRWAVVEFDTSATGDLSEVIDGCVRVVSEARRAAARPLAARIELVGATPLRDFLLTRFEQVRAGIISRLNETEPDVWVEKLVDRTRSPKQMGAAQSDAVEAIRVLAERAMTDDDVLDRFARGLRDLETKVGSTLLRMEGTGSTSPFSRDSLRTRLPDVAEMLIARLEER